MKHPSKKTALLAVQEQRKRVAFADNDVAAFTKAVNAMKRLARQRDEYTCLACGKDFDAEAAHVDLLVAAVSILGPIKGVFQTLDHGDYGILTAQQTGRRIKICKRCFSRWKIPIMTYLEMR